MRLCVIIPTFNNAATIRQVVEGVWQYCQNIIVVNDGSTDATAEILKTISVDVEVVSFEKNKGKGAALVAGFRRAKELAFTHAITIDADGQHFPDDIPSLTSHLSPLTSETGIIVGARNLTEENMPRQNTFANKFSNFWFRLQTGINLPDTQSGFRLYTLKDLKGLSLITSRYESELELLVFAAWAGVKVSSVPVRVYYPPAEERVSHFRPVYDFVRISILNTVLCIAALLYGWPRMLVRGLRKAVYTIFSFCYFIGLAIDMTLRGFFLITIGDRLFPQNRDEHKLRYHRILQRKARFVINHVPGTTFAYHNAHNETFEKPAVIISNHQSHLDLMGIMMLTPNLIILTKKWVWHNPFYGIIIRYADFFPITETEEMTQNIEKMVKKGYSVMVFPEGTRSEDCHIQRFHRGAFYLAEKLNLDILPVYINGFGTVLPKTSFHLHPGHMSVEVMPRITQQSSKGYREMAKQVHNLYVKKRSTVNG